MVKTTCKKCATNVGRPAITAARDGEGVAISESSYADRSWPVAVTDIFSSERTRYTLDQWKTVKKQHKLRPGLDSKIMNDISAVLTKCVDP